MLTASEEIDDNLQQDLSSITAEPQRKRVRYISTDQSSVSLHNLDVNSAPTAVRTRGISACEKCRLRKSKCDNQRPSCGYCAKHRLLCAYTDDATTSQWVVTGGQILDAIGNLSALVQRQHSECSSCSGRVPDSCSTTLYSKTLGSASGAETDDARPVARIDESGSLAAPVPPLFQPQGMESILEWRIMDPYRTSVCLFADDQASFLPTNSLPRTDLEALSELASNYIHGVHFKNPILNVSELEQMMLHVAENGLDWSTRTCLVTLVCAIGAMTQVYQNHHLPPTNHLTPGAPHPSTGSRPTHEISMQYWTLASRRLGLAIGQTDLQAVQCLCLAGIWYMHQMQPLQAWKYFNLAGAAWLTVKLTADTSAGTLYAGTCQMSSSTVTQALYFTIWKSECEIRLELDVPGPILGNVDFPDAFPDPPSLSGNPNLADHERGWYYYLAEIAARHVLNRVLRTCSWTADTSTEKEVRRMVENAEALESQIHKWYTSLPPIFNFEIPEGYTIQPHHDDMTQILRHRYLACRELVGRPFVKLSIESTLNFEPQLRARVVSLASQCLRYCVLKLSQVAPHLHQGTWFMLRNAATSALILSAVDLAQRNPWLPGAQALLLPEGWRERIEDAIEIISPYWSSPAGGAKNIRMVVQSVLDSSDRS